MSVSSFGLPREVLTALRAERGDCPTLDELLTLEQADPEVRARLERHLELCATCAATLAAEEEPVDDLTWRRTERRLDARERPWTPSASPRPARPGWPAALAAGLLLSLGGVAVWQMTSDGTPAVSGVPRGAALQPLAPVGPVTSVDELRWRAPAALELYYRVEVRDASGEVASWPARKTSLLAPPELVERLAIGVELRWRVVGLDDDGEEVASSDWTAFSLREE